MYDTLASFAQTWGLIYFALLFVAAVAWAFRPGSKARFDEAARIPLRED